MILSQEEQEQQSSRESMLLHLKAQLEKEIHRLPETKVYVSVQRGNPRYYLKDEKKQNTYLPKSKADLIQKAFQREYDLKILKHVNFELKKLNQIKKLQKQSAPENVILLLHPAKQKMIQPYLLSDSEFLKAWEEIEYKKLGFAEDDPEHYSERGERMRSKSELFIAAKLDKLGIPYRYEKPLLLTGGITVHPDFTVLNMRTRKEIYIEHLGMMDDQNYVETTMKKIESYEKSGYYPGDRLILFHETNHHPLDLRVVEKMLIKFCT